MTHVASEYEEVAKNNHDMEYFMKNHCIKIVPTHTLSYHHAFTKYLFASVAHISLQCFEITDIGYVYLMLLLLFVHIVHSIYIFRLRTSKSI